MRYKNFIFQGILFAVFEIFALQAAPPKWIDIPHDDYEKLAAISDARFNKLNALTENYHNISKTSEKDIEKRLRELEKVMSFIEDWMLDKLPFKLHFFLKNILSIAKNKHEHLEELNNVYKKNQTTQKSLEEYHLDTSELKESYRPIFLCNRRMYDSLNGQYWGEYWMETADPCHRQLTPFYELFRSRYGLEPSLLDFFLWLEEQNLSKDVPYLRFLNDEELNRATVRVKDGLLYFMVDRQEIQVNYSDPKEEYIFNIDLEERLLIVPATKTIHHVSLSRGKPVLGCGNMVIKSGLIQSIELESGHYLPSIADGVQVLQILEKMGILLPPSTSFSYYEEGRKHQTTVAQFLASFQ